MDNTTKPIKQAFREYLAEHPTNVVTEQVWRDLMTALAPVSESYLRELLRNAAVPVEAPYGGVAQHTLEELEASLRLFLQVYEDALASGDRSRARYCRRQVIAGKDKAKFLVANPKTTAEKRALKQEMVEWMLVWLENPPVFPAWVDARKLEMKRAEESLPSPDPTDSTEDSN